MAFAIRPETFVDIVDMLVPELQRRGRYKTDYANGTLREKLFGRPRLGQQAPCRDVPLDLIKRLCIGTAARFRAIVHAGKLLTVI